MKIKTYTIQKHHVPIVAQIEKLCYPNEFLTKLQIDKIVERLTSDGYVVLANDKPIAYVLYDTNDNDIEILRLGVHPYYRHSGYGRSLLNKVKTKLTPNKDRLFIHVPDSLLDGQLFLQKQGLIASKVDRRHYRKHFTDSYLFVFLRDWDYLDAKPDLIEDEVVASSGV